MSQPPDTVEPSGAEPVSPAGSGGALSARAFGAIDFRNTRFWVALLVVLLVVLNALAFGVYAAAHPGEGFADQLWSYFESDTAKLITVSLILPLLVFVIEGRFNVTETVRASRVERARTAQDERRDARLETIAQTSETWNGLFAVTTRISSPDGDLDFADLRARLWNAPVLFEDLINRWRVRFPNLSSEGVLFTSYSFMVNILIECAASALFHVRNADSEEERVDVRGSIDLIASGTDQAVRGAIPDILNASLELMEIRESLGVEELRMVESDAEGAALMAAYEEQITARIEVLGSWADFVRAHLTTRQTLATVEGPEVAEFRRLFHELAAAVREDPAFSLADDPRSATLEALYGQIPRAQRLHAWNVKYSSAWLAALADGFVFNDFLSELGDPAVSPSS